MDADETDTYSTTYAALIILAKVGGFISMVGSSLIIYDLYYNSNNNNNKRNRQHQQQQQSPSLWRRLLCCARGNDNTTTTNTAMNRNEDGLNNNNDTRRPPFWGRSFRFSSSGSSSPRFDSTSESQVASSFRAPSLRMLWPAQRMRNSSLFRQSNNNNNSSSTMNLRRSRNNRNNNGNNSNLTRNQIIYCLSLTDWVSSLLLHFLGSWMVPQGQVWGSAGTNATCNAQGYVGTCLSAMSILLNVALAASCLMTVRRSQTQGLKKASSSQNQPWYQKLFDQYWFPVCFLTPTVLGILPILLDNFNWSGLWTCAVNALPHRCQGSECDRGFSLMKWLLIIPFSIASVLLVICVVMLYWTVLQQERAGDKYTMAAAANRQRQKQQEEQQQDNNKNQRKSSNTGSGFLTAAQRREQREQRAQERQLLKNRKWSRRVANQGINFVGAYFATYIFYILYLIIEADPVWLRFASAATLPLQGFFNAYVYFLPKYVAWRRQRKAAQKRREQQAEVQARMLQMQQENQQRQQNEGGGDHSDSQSQSHSYSTTTTFQHNVGRMSDMNWQSLGFSSHQPIQETSHYSSGRLSSTATLSKYEPEDDDDDDMDDINDMMMMDDINDDDMMENDEYDEGVGEDSNDENGKMNETKQSAAGEDPTETMVTNTSHSFDVQDDEAKEEDGVNGDDGNVDHEMDEEVGNDRDEEVGDPPAEKNMDNNNDDDDDVEQFEQEGTQPIIG